MEDTWTISDVSKFLGVSEKTLRSWDSKGILKASKTDGGHRRYDPEAVREFLKERGMKHEKSLSDDFAAADLRTKNNQAERDVAFWKDKGFLPEDLDKYGMMVLATLLSNQMAYSQSLECPIGRDYPIDDFAVNLVLGFYENLTSRQFVHIGAMNAPTGLHYYSRIVPSSNWKPKNEYDIPEFILTIESDVLYAKTRKTNCYSVVPREQTETILVLDPVSFVPIHQPKLNPIPYQNDVDPTWLAKWNGKNIAIETDDFIIEDLWDHAEQIKLPIEKSFHHKYETNFIITNEIGLKLIEKHLNIEMPEIIDRSSTQLVVKTSKYRIFYNPKLKGMLFGQRGIDVIKAPYSYCVYVPATHTPEVIDRNGYTSSGFLVRADRKFHHVNDGVNPFYKIVF